MSAQAVFANPLVLRLISALGLEPNETRKVVIELDCDKLVTIYAVLYPNADDIKRVCEVFEAEVIPVADVVVSDDATVTVTPLPSTHQP